MIKKNIGMRPARRSVLNFTLDALTNSGQSLLVLTLAIWQGVEILVWCLREGRAVAFKIRQKIKTNLGLKPDSSRHETLDQPTVGGRQG